ncbi:MAG: hypothetical protein JJ964_14895 [Rhizobiales bacterium]|nr:hypothetical protein [Hyphomicrobiales bacterium]
MTRRTLRKKIRKYVLFLLALIVIAGFAKFSTELGFPHKWLDSVYKFIIDMSLLIFTIGAAYLANVFQQRSNFITNLKDEWHEIVRAKSSLIVYLDKPNRTVDDYFHAYQHLSQCIDYMRIVYRNVGETDKLIGKYPYEPLHDMRRSIESVDPRKGQVTEDALLVARADIWGAFNALRERFLEELDLETPERPIIAAGAKRKKKEGAAV